MDLFLIVSCTFIQCFAATSLRDVSLRGVLLGLPWSEFFCMRLDALAALLLSLGWKWPVFIVRWLRCLPLHRGDGDPGAVIMEFGLKTVVYQTSSSLSMIVQLNVILLVMFSIILISPCSTAKDSACGEVIRASANPPSYLSYSTRSKVKSHQITLSLFVTYNSKILHINYI